MHPKLMSDRPLTLPKAWALYRGFATLPGVAMLPEPQDLDTDLGALITPKLPPRLLTDAYFAALAGAAGCGWSRSTGISNASIASRCSACRRLKPHDHGHDPQGNHPRRRLGQPAASGDARDQQAAAAGVRQADGLLPAQHADARRHPRDPADQHAAGHAALRGAARRRLAVGHRDPLLRAAEPRRPGAGVHPRQRASSTGSRARSSSATTSSTATTCSGCSSRRASAERRDGVRLPRARPGALRRRRVRRAAARARASRKSPRRRRAATPSRACTSTTPTSATSPHRSALRRAASSRSPTSTRATSSAATSTSRCSAAATPGSTPARTTACSRPASSSRRSRSARA